jgi:hypothetical protein
VTSVYPSHSEIPSPPLVKRVCQRKMTLTSGLIGMIDLFHIAGTDTRSVLGVVGNSGIRKTKGGGRFGAGHLCAEKV